MFKRKLKKRTIVSTKKIKRNAEDDQFERLLRIAEEEGRIDGPHKCTFCGMRYLTHDEAVDCCKSL